MVICLDTTSISIHLMLMLIAKEAGERLSYLNFNTSHVNVNPCLLLALQGDSGYFNTSHVNVNPCLLLALQGDSGYFNTSHVNVNPRHCNRQIHLQTHFNTSHVNVNR